MLQNICGGGGGAIRNLVPQLGALSHPFLGEGSPTKINHRKQFVPTYSNIFTGGPRKGPTLETTNNIKDQIGLMRLTD